jgi:hypothetical protein
LANHGSQRPRRWYLTWLEEMSGGSLSVIPESKIFD